jgi:hypothetical protein
MEIDSFRGCVGGCGLRGARDGRTKVGSAYDLCIHRPATHDPSPMLDFFWRFYLESP